MGDRLTAYNKAMFFRPQNPPQALQELTAARQPFQIRLPFLRQQIGAGDVAAGITQAIGIQPCEPCKQRQERMNQAVAFRPWDA